jgi:hypothetical protein
MPDRAQQNSVAGLQQVERAGGHHLPPAEKVGCAPVEVLKRKAEIVFVGGMLQHALGLGDDLQADAVAGDHRYGKGFHGIDLSGGS